MATRRVRDLAFKPIDTKNLDPRTSRQHVRNIANVYTEADPKTVREGREWYPRAHDVAAKVGGGDVRKGAGMIAAMSPGMDWATNIAQAHHMSQAPLRGHQVALLAQHERVARAATQALAAAERTHGEGRAPAHLYEQAAAARNEHLAARHQILGGTPLINQSTSNILRAHGIQHGETAPEDVLPMRVKTGNFYRNIVDPSDKSPVTIDTHAHDIAVDRLLPWKQNRGLSAVGRYEHFADSYRQAAHKVGGEVPATVQAVTWTAWKNRHGQKRQAAMGFE